MLFIKIDKQLRQPYYQQVADSLEKAIADGLLKVDDILPKK